MSEGATGMSLPTSRWSDDRGKVDAGGGSSRGEGGVIHSRVNSPRRAEGLRNSLPLQDVVQGSKRNAQSLALVSGTGETVQDGGPLARQHSSRAAAAGSIAGTRAGNPLQ